MTDYNAGDSLTEAVTTSKEALAALQRLGRSDLADDALTAAESSTNYTALDDDREHNDQWKQSAYARQYTSVMATLATKLTAVAKTVGSTDQDDAARVYGIKGLPGDVASLTISRRDAGDRIAGINDSNQLRRLLVTATRTGDEVLAHAIVEAAIQSDDSDTTDAFIAAYPHLAEAVQRLWAAEHNRLQSIDLTTAWRLAALKPAPIKNLMDYEIAAAAAAPIGQPSIGAWNA